MANQRDKGKTTIYTNQHGNWQKFGLPRTPRTLESGL